MAEIALGQSSPWGLDPWGERMLAPDEVAQMVRLHQLGWGTRRIAGELGCSRNTVKRYLAAGGWVAIRPARRPRRLDGFEDWLKERFRRHPRQLRCGALGPRARARGHGVVADGGARGGAAAPSVASRGASVPAV